MCTDIDDLCELPTVVYNLGALAREAEEQYWRAAFTDGVTDAEAQATAEASIDWAQQ